VSTTAGGPGENGANACSAEPLVAPATRDAATAAEAGPGVLLTASTGTDAEACAGTSNDSVRAGTLASGEQADSMLFTASQRSTDKCAVTVEDQASSPSCAAEHRQVDQEHVASDELSRGDWVLVHDPVLNESKFDGIPEASSDDSDVQILVAVAGRRRNKTLYASDSDGEVSSDGSDTDEQGASASDSDSSSGSESSSMTESEDEDASESSEDESSQAAVGQTAHGAELPPGPTEGSAHGCEAATLDSGLGVDQRAGETLVDVTADVVDVSGDGDDSSSADDSSASESTDTSLSSDSSDDSFDDQLYSGEEDGDDGDPSGSSCDEAEAAEEAVDDGAPSSSEDDDDDDDDGYTDGNGRVQKAHAQTGVIHGSDAVAMYAGCKPAAQRKKRVAPTKAKSADKGVNKCRKVTGGATVGPGGCVAANAVEDTDDAGLGAVDALGQGDCPPSASPDRQRKDRRGTPGKKPKGKPQAVSVPAQPDDDHSDDDSEESEVDVQALITKHSEPKRRRLGFESPLQQAQQSPRQRGEKVQTTLVFG
jgi:hypothetical protein